jgi:hypothetical protein
MKGKKRNDAVGKKGRSGRPPVRKERQELLWVLERWQKGEEVQKILDKKARGETLALRETLVLRASQGSEPILNKLSDKILPDKLDDEALEKLRFVTIDI